MKNWYYRMPFKVLAFVGAVLCLLAVLGGALGTTFLADWGVYTTGQEEQTTRQLYNRLRQYEYDACVWALYGEEGYGSRSIDGLANLRGSVRLAGYTLAADKDTGEDLCRYQGSTDLAELFEHLTLADLLTLPGVQAMGEQRTLLARELLGQLGAAGLAPEVQPPAAEAPGAGAEGADEAAGAPGWLNDPEDTDSGLMQVDLCDAAREGLIPNVELTVTLWVPKDMTVHDSLWWRVWQVEAAYALADVLPKVAIGCAAALLVLGIYLLCAAGRRADTGTTAVVLGPAARMPLDVYVALCAALACCGIMVLLESARTALQYLDAMCLLLACVSALGLGTLVVGFAIDLAARIKAGGFFKNTVIWRLGRLALRSARWLWRWVRYLLAGLPLMWKTLLAGTALLALDMYAPVYFYNGYDGTAIFLMLAAHCAALVVALLITLNLRSLQKAVHRMAAGELDAPVDTDHLLGDFRRSGEELGRIREGINSAVAQQLKSERLKTELITNVSHDIKTPLTSIINYVDLLKKEQMPSQTAADYLAVLERQSARLKKLIEDLIEASKASSGALATRPEPCQLGVLLGQVAGEYAGRLEAAGLTPVLEVPEQPLAILADGRHMWRIFDNLLNNICKYAQSGTRVYMSLVREGERALVVFRNISQAPLNIPGEELLERFVRGDRSRHTEGSGLGLSIARSLAELQGGKLLLTIDGDLFKVTLSFPALPPTAAETAAPPAFVESAAPPALVEPAAPPALVEPAAPPALVEPAAPPAAAETAAPPDTAEPAPPQA